MDVIFETSDGRELEVELWYFDTVLEMKKKVEKYHKIPVSCQTLIFNGQVMKDHLDTEFYTVLLNSRIRLQILDPPPPTPQVPQPDQPDHEQDHHPAASTKETEESIGSSSSSKSRTTWTKIQERTSSVVASSSSSSTSMTPTTTKTQLALKIPYMRCYLNLGRDLTDTVGGLKQSIFIFFKHRVYEFDGIPVVRIILKFSGEELIDDNLTLSDYGLFATTSDLPHEMDVIIQPCWI